jgi:hypothetical protein
MRKKIYFQNNFGDLGDKEFIYNGVKTTFGMFTKEFKERRFEVSDILRQQHNFLLEQLGRKDLLDRMLTRYHSYTDYDYEAQFRMNVYKVTLLVLALREVKIVLKIASFEKFLCKSFRCIIGSRTCMVEELEIRRKKRRITSLCHA